MKYSVKYETTNYAFKITILITISLLISQQKICVTYLKNKSVFSHILKLSLNLIYKVKNSIN